MASVNPSDLLAQLKAYNSVDPLSIDPLLRKHIQNAASTLAHDLQDPATATQRLTLGQAAESAALKVALDINLFPFLQADNKAKTLNELSVSTSTDPVLLQRLLRFLAAFHVVIEQDDGEYALSSPCKILGDEGFAKATNVVLPLVRLMLDAFPALVQENGRKNPNDRFNGAAQKAWNAPGKELFDMVKEMGPEVAQSFSVFLSMGSKDSAKMHEVYPVRERLIEGLGEDSGERVFWVDVGGGFGQCTTDLIDTFPDLPGKCIVQDLEPVVNMARLKGLGQDAGVEFIAHNFFEEQPIKGARTYYLRQIFHNWQDTNCRTILERTREAMTPGYSRLLIHDIVMPERNASQWAVMMDWLMMAGYSTCERSRVQWEELIRGVEGLRIEKIYGGVGDGSAESVIEVVRV